VGRGQAQGVHRAEREFVEFRKVEDRNLESDFDRAVKQLPPPTKDKPS
jgi:hypothetical protein